MVISKINYPKVTICVPVRNGALTIRRTLDSLLKQDYPYYEIIVSDNCSDDNTAEIVKPYVSQGIQYYNNPKTEKWAESNWNYILTLAQGTFIALYHADDIYTPTMVRRQVEFFIKHPDASAVFTMTQSIDELDRPIKRGKTELLQELKGKEIFHYKETLNYTLKYTNFMVVPTMMTKRSVIDRVGVFNCNKYKTASDIDLYLRMTKVGPIGIIDEPLHKYRISNQQGSALIFYQRTFLAHFFNVLDDYISIPDSNEIIQADALSVYNLLRASDQISCAINMLLLNRVMEAKTNLINALKIKHMTNALKMAIFEHPRELMLFCVGYFLLISSYLGFGHFSGKQIHKVIQRHTKNKLKPISENQDGD